MACEIEYTDEFGVWWKSLDEDEQESIATAVLLLEQRGPQLPFPYSSGVKGSRHGHMREFRWYQEIIPVADKLYDQHLLTLKKEGLYG